MTDPRYERRKALFLAVSELNDSERQAFLDRECARDDDLRREVEALLNAPAPDRLKPGGALEIVGVSSDDSNVSHSPGVNIGNYRLLERIGDGAFGEVWVAEQENPVRPRVALKILKAGMDTREVLARFEAERRALAKMNHPNVAKVFDAGATPQGRPYFVMEYVPGVPITEYCDTSRLSIRQRLELFVDVCRGVQHAHQRGIIHRDLKPHNILVTIHGGRAEPKVIDFGVAKAALGDEDEETYKTEAGRGIGTPEYMSPEQTGKVESDTDVRTDVYSLGVVLYELLTGTLPLDFRSMRRARFDKIAEMICESDPPTPSTRLSTLASASVTRTNGAEPETLSASRGCTLHALVRSLKGDLDWIVARTLEKDRRRRYESVAALAEDIRRHLDHQPVIAAPPSTAYRFHKLVRRHRNAVAAGGFAIVVLLLATVISIYFAYRERLQSQLAHEARVQEAAHRREAEAARDRALAIKRFLIEALQSHDPHAPGGRTDMLVSEAMHRAISLLDEGQLKEQPRVVTELLNAISTILLNLGKPSEAEQVARQALQWYETNHHDDESDKAECQGNLGFCLISLGRPDDALEQFEAALRIKRRTDSQHDHVTVKLLNGIGFAFEDLGRPAEALQYHEAALESCSTLTNGDHNELAACIGNLASCLSSLGRPEDALSRYQEALDMCRRIFDGDHPDVATGLNNVAHCLKAMGRNPEAEMRYRESLAMRERLWPKDHPDVAESLGNLADCLFNQGQLHEALPLYERCISMLENIYGPDHPRAATARFGMSACLAALGRKPEAAEQLRTVIRIRRQILPLVHPDTAVAEMSLGGLLIQIGEFEQAEALLLDVENRLRDRDDVPRFTRRCSLTVLIKLYDTLDRAAPNSGHDAKAAVWKGRLAEFDADTTAPSNSPTSDKP